MSKSSIVVGGGIIGLLSAYRLAQAGFSVDLFDPHIAKGATYAAAGMLAPGGEITSGEQSQYLVQLKSTPSWELLSHDRDLRRKRRIGFRVVLANCDNGAF